MDRDPFRALEGDLDAALEPVTTAGPRVAELYVYAGASSLFTGGSPPD